MKKVAVFFLGFLFIFNTYSQTYRTRPLSQDVHTIQVNIEGNWATLPIIDLYSNKFIQINFDILGRNSLRTLRYRIINCDAYWNKSRLSDIEYVDGFNNLIIEDYAQSVNTTVDYTNYNLEIPNDRQKLKLSGNYVVEVYEEDNPEKVLLTACFSVLDSKVKINGGMTSNTDIDVNKENQQVFFTINTNNLQIRDPFSELKILVRQNRRIDNQRIELKPTYIQENNLIYEHNKDLIFEAGNEYRRFETVSDRFNGLNIESTEYINPYNMAYIKPSKIRSKNRYIYDQDQNGAFLIRNAEANDPYTEADYFETSFSLNMDQPMIEPIYLNGAFTYDLFDETYKMKYDVSDTQYKNTILLKQGAYNYLYMAKDGKKYTTSLIEGNYYETRNLYMVYVYYRQLGSFHDQLIGLLNIE